MALTLNKYFQIVFSNTNLPRVIVYPNNTTAAQLLNHHKNKENIIVIADCINEGDTHLPMPNVLMNTIDAKIQTSKARSLVVGLDAYLALLNIECVDVFMCELRNRLDASELNADYMLSVRNKPVFMPRYEESHNVVVIEGSEETLEPLSIQAYSDKWVKIGASIGYKQLLDKMGIYEPSGNYTLILADLTERHVGIGNVVSFVLKTHDVATQHYGLGADLSDTTLEQLLSESAKNEKKPEAYLENLFGLENINIRRALKRLLEIPDDKLWPAHLWMLRQRLPHESYIEKVLSTDITHDNLLRKYAIETTITVLSDINAKKYAEERAEALKEVGSEYESLIVEFIGLTKESDSTLPFLNCGTSVERTEIVRRSSNVDLSHGLPKEYGKLFPSLADYFSSTFEFDDEAITVYFEDYRKYKVSGCITDDFAKRAFDSTAPKTYLARDVVLAELQTQPDIALLVVDAMGAEYMPLLIAMAKRRGMNIESQAVVTAKLPTATCFNPIKWDKARTLPEVKDIDNIVHYGAVKNEDSLPEKNFAKTLRVFETEVMNRIVEGLAQFARVAVTADHGASRLAVIAHNERKDTTLPWVGQPDNWRYSLAPYGAACPSELEQEYLPETKQTYWIVRGYNRLPKMGGIQYEVHGGATLEERLVPLIVFTKQTVEEVPEQVSKKTTSGIVDEFEGLI